MTVGDSDLVTVKRAGIGLRLNLPEGDCGTDEDGLCRKKRRRADAWGYPEWRAE